jgi:hypothetical protein
LLRAFESNDPDRLAEDPRPNAKAAVEVAMVAPRTMAMGNFMVVAVSGGRRRVVSRVVTRNFSARLETRRRCVGCAGMVWYNLVQYRVPYRMDHGLSKSFDVTFFNHSREVSSQSHAQITTHKKLGSYYNGTYFYVIPIRYDTFMLFYGTVTSAKKKILK